MWHKWRVARKKTESSSSWRLMLNPDQYYTQFLQRGVSRVSRVRIRVSVTLGLGLGLMARICGWSGTVGPLEAEMVRWMDQLISYWSGAIICGDVLNCLSSHESRKWKPQQRQTSEWRQIAGRNAAGVHAGNPRNPRQWRHARRRHRGVSAGEAVRQVKLGG